MTGEELARLMVNRVLKATIAQHARRYSKDVQNQEEYIQDAWMRIAKQDAGMGVQYYEDHARKAIKASNERKRYSRTVQKKRAQNLDGISEGVRKIPKNAMDLGRGRYLCVEPHKLDSWYYDGEWNDWVKVRGASNWHPSLQDTEEDSLPVSKGDSYYRGSYDEVITVPQGSNETPRQNKSIENPMRRDMFDRDLDAHNKRAQRWVNHVEVRPECMDN